MVETTSTDWSPAATCRVLRAHAKSDALRATARDETWDALFLSFLNVAERIVSDVSDEPTVSDGDFSKALEAVASVSQLVERVEKEGNFSNVTLLLSAVDKKSGDQVRANHLSTVVEAVAKLPKLRQGVLGGQNGGLRDAVAAVGEE